MHGTTCMWVVLRVTLWINLFVIIQMKFQTLLLCGIVNCAVHGDHFVCVTVFSTFVTNNFEFFLYNVHCVLLPWPNWLIFQRH